MNSTIGCTDREIIQLIARQHNSREKPSWYINKAMTDYKRKVSNSSVTKAIGTYANRNREGETLLLQQARSFLSSCHFDTAYANHLIIKAFMS